MPLNSYPENETQSRSECMAPGVLDPTGTRGRPSQQKVYGDSRLSRAAGSIWAWGSTALVTSHWGGKGESFCFRFCFFNFSF